MTRLAWCPDVAGCQTWCMYLTTSEEMLAVNSAWKVSCFAEHQKYNFESVGRL